MKHQICKTLLWEAPNYGLGSCDNPTTFRTPVSDLWSRGFLFSSGLIGNCPAGHGNRSHDDEWPLTQKKTIQVLTPTIIKKASAQPTVWSTRVLYPKVTARGEMTAINVDLIPDSSILRYGEFRDSQQ